MTAEEIKADDKAFVSKMRDLGMSPELTTISEELEKVGDDYQRTFDLNTKLIWKLDTAVKELQKVAENLAKYIKERNWGEEYWEAEEDLISIYAALGKIEEKNEE